MHHARRISLTILGCYLAVLLVLMFLENAMIFPAPRFPFGDWSPGDLDFEDVFFESEDGTRLHGWYVPHPEPRGFILHCHGNGEHVAFNADRLQVLYELGYSTFVFDYRGYGRSEGSPNEVGVLADARAAQQWLSQRAEKPPSDLIYMGRSLGGAVAVDLASRTGARALILEATFTSLPDVAARLYWWAPVRWCMRSQFNALERIENYQGPLLQNHGTADTLVPLDIGRQLFDAAPSEAKRFIELRGDGHNDWPPPSYWQAVDEFISSCE